MGSCGGARGSGCAGRAVGRRAGQRRPSLPRPGLISRRGRSSDQVPSASMRLRPATLDDAEAIRQIYNVEVLTSVATFDLVPRNLEDQRAWQSARSGPHTVMVADDEGEVVGLGAPPPLPARPADPTKAEAP